MPPSEHNARGAAVVGWLANGLLLALAIVVAVVWSYAMFFREYGLAATDGEGATAESPYAAEIRRRVEAHSDEIIAEGESLAADTLPPLGTALASRAKQDYPIYLATAEKQGKIYLREVEDIFAEKVKGQYHDYLLKHREVLAEEFPEHADKQAIDRMMKQFQAEFDKLVHRYYLDQFRQQTQRTVKLWESVEPLPPPKPGEPPLESQLADYLADWSVLAFTNETEQQLLGD